MKSHELIQFNRQLHKLWYHMHDTNYKGRNLDTYLKHDDPKDRYLSTPRPRYSTLL